MKGSKVLPGGFMWMFILLLATGDARTTRRPGTGTGGGSGGSGGGSGGTGDGSTGGSGGSTGGSGGSTGGSGGSTGGSGGGSTGGTGQQHTYPPSNGWSGTTYRPPQQIQHGSNTFPVSQTAPPASVYQMRDSGSRYSSLITGLMLWNVARRTSTVSSTPVCRFRMRTNSTTEYRRINCNTISSFIREWDNQANNATGNNSTGIDIPGAGNLTIIEDDNFNSNGTMDVLEDIGQTILVTPDMVCHVIRTWNRRTTRQQVDCMVLQLYTANAWQRTDEGAGGDTGGGTGGGSGGGSGGGTGGDTGGGSGGAGGGVPVPDWSTGSNSAKSLTTTLIFIPIYFLRFIL